MFIFEEIIDEVFITCHNHKPSAVKPLYVIMKKYISNGIIRAQLELVIEDIIGNENMRHVIWYIVMD